MIDSEMVGKRIRVNSLKGEPENINNRYAGRTGTIAYVDDIGQYHIAWDDSKIEGASGLAVIPGEDSFEILNESVRPMQGSLLLEAAEDRMDRWHNGKRKEEPKNWTDEQLEDFYKVCKSKKYTAQARAIDAERKFRKNVYGKIEKIVKKYAGDDVDLDKEIIRIWNKIHKKDDVYAELDKIAKSYADKNAAKRKKAVNESFDNAELTKMIADHDGLKSFKQVYGYDARGYESSYDLKTAVAQCYIPEELANYFGYFNIFEPLVDQILYCNDGGIIVISKDHDRPSYWNDPEYPAYEKKMRARNDAFREKYGEPHFRWAGIDRTGTTNRRKERHGIGDEKPFFSNY